MFVYPILYINEFIQLNKNYKLLKNIWFNIHNEDFKVCQSDKRFAIKQNG